jgi:DNA-directed RNA polymerase subunit RPC12/RpoP
MCHDPNPYEGADDGEIPADSYYACISDDTTWDADGNQIYGELGDLDDIYPDIIVSRIAINHEQKMTDWISEVINYECTPAEAEWTDKVILIGPNVHNTEDGAKQNEYFYNKYLKYVYGSFDKYYEDSDAGEPLTKTEVLKSVNSGSTFLNYLGHGGPSTWTYNFGYSKLIDKGDVNKFTNKGMKPVVYAMSCLTQWFDDPTDSGYGNFGDCIGETFTENVIDGGIGYIGSSRTSVGIINQNYGPFATGLQEDYISQLGQFNFGLGSSYTEAKKSYSKNWGNYFPDTNSNGEVQACWLEVNLLGEPELTLWTKAPEKFIITNESDEETLRITVKNESGGFIKDAQVCIQLSNSKGKLEILQLKETSNNGEVEFYISGFPEKLNLTISKTNFIPYLERITIADMIPPITDYEINPIAPDGENDWYITSPMINLSINEEGKIYYYWDDGPQQEYLGPIFALEGDHIFNFYSVDESDNIEVVQNIKIKVDLIPPECILELDPVKPNGQHGWYIVQPTINFTSEANTSVYYSFDDDVSLLYSDPFNAPVGVHEIHYYSKDMAGHKGVSITETIKVDIIPPISNLKVNPSSPTGLNGWYTSIPTISFESEEEAEIFYYWSNDNDGQDISNPSNAVLYRTPISCPEGKNVLHYYSIDYAGCTEVIQSYKIKLDTQPPGTEIKINPEIPDGENGFYVSNTLISLKSEPNATRFYNWDDDSALKYTNQIKVPEGIHTLTYYSMDEAGNTGEELVIELKLDSIAPTTNVILTPQQPTGNNDWYIEIPIMEFDSEPDALIYYHFEGFNDIPVPLQLEVPEGITKIYYHSVDSAGNIGSEEWVNIKVDITTPEATLKSDESTYKIEDTITFDAGQSKDKNGIDSYYFDFGDGENTGWIISSHVKHQYKKSGEYIVTLRVIDDSGLENEIEETFDVLIIKESKESYSFLFDDVSVIITLVIGIFIILTTLFIFTYKRYYEPVVIPDRARVPIELEDELVSEEITTSRPKELKEAIIMDKPVVFKMKKLKCPGCGSIFMGEEHTDQIKCPSCGLKGKLPASSSKDIDTDLEDGKDTKHSKFKCPVCGSLFRTQATDGFIKCPGCGVKGEI